MVDKWVAQLLDKNDHVRLEISEGGILKHGGPLQAVVVEVGRAHLKVDIKQTIEVPLVDVDRIEKTAGTEQPAEGLEQITPTVADINAHLDDLSTKPLAGAGARGPQDR